VRILFATAEFRPLVSVGGLGEAASGLVRGLRKAGHEVEVVLADYSGWELENEEIINLDMPHWAQPTVIRSGSHRDAGAITLIDTPGMRRDNPYVDADGVGWSDNDRRFAAFGAAIAALASYRQPDVVHLNDWHTSMAPAFWSEPAPPSVLTIHNLAHQGWANSGWLDEVRNHRTAYQRGDAFNALAGAIIASDAVVAVSPQYAQETCSEPMGMGLSGLMVAKGEDLRGILNGIDIDAWNPMTDPDIPAPYGPGQMEGKGQARRALLERAGWDPKLRGPLFCMVTRLVDQKGVDLAFEAAQYLPGMRARMLVLGSGDPALAEHGYRLAAAMPDHFWFYEGFDVALSHLFFAGSDLLLMPSRFEPCGLAQMQAMAYGTLPVVTAVGGLVDSVPDADINGDGLGFVSETVDTVGVVDAMHRSLAAWRNTSRRKRIIALGMAHDWSWDGPTQQFVQLYQEVCAR